MDTKSETKLSFICERPNISNQTYETDLSAAQLTKFCEKRCHLFNVWLLSEMYSFVFSVLACIDVFLIVEDDLINEDV